MVLGELIGELFCVVVYLVNEPYTTGPGPGKRCSRRFCEPKLRRRRQNGSQNGFEGGEAPDLVDSHDMSTFRHVMLMTFKNTATPDQIDAALAGLGTMPGLVPGILRYEFGVDLNVMEGNPDLALIADFASEDDWRAYLSHPEHEAMSASAIAPIKGEMTRVQYLVE